MQDRVELEYQIMRGDEAHTLSALPNSSIVDSIGDFSTSNGIIENVHRIWMHPFRDIDYILTEITPFPEVRLPLKQDASWYDQLTLGDGWGIWSGLVMQIAKYKIDIFEQVSLTDFKGHCRRIIAKSITNLPNSYLAFWFNERIGFVEMHYRFYNGHIRTFVVCDVSN